MAKNFKIGLASLAVILSALTSCGGNQNSKEVLLNGFETMDDLYNVRQLMSEISYSVRAKLELNTDTNYIKSGSSSLKIEHKTSECSSIFQRIDTTSILDGRDISDIAKLSLWVYNDTEDELPVLLNVIGQEQTVLTSHTSKVPSKQWTLVSFDINKVVVQYNYKTIQGFSFGFDGTCPITCYVDDFKLSFGSEYTEEDKKYMSTVESLNERMGALPESISVTDTASIEEARKIGLEYEAIPSVYRVACTNYSRYLTCLSSFVQSYSTDYATESTVTSLFFGSIFGLSQVSLGIRTQTFPLSYCEDKKYADEVGTLKAEITDNNPPDWWKFDATTPFQLQSYKYFEMKVYPDTDHDIAVEVSWDGAHILKAKQWNNVRIYCEDFPEGTTSKLEIEFIGMDDEGAPTGFLGNVYFANAYLVRNSAEDFANMVNTLLPIENLTYDNLIDVERIYDFYYNLDINEQSKQVAIEALIILNAAYDKVLSEGKKLLPEKITALPDTTNFKAYHSSLVEQCMTIYNAMTDEEKASLVNRQKLLDLNEYSNSHYGVVYTPSESLLNYSTFRGTTDSVEVRYDDNYGKVFHCSSSDCTYGMAFNFSYGNLDEYSEIRFFVSSKNWARFGLFVEPWWTTAYDFTTHSIVKTLLDTRFIIDDQEIHECVIPVDDFLAMNYFMFHSWKQVEEGESPVTLPVDGIITQFYGVKK